MKVLYYICLLAGCLACGVPARAAETPSAAVLPPAQLGRAAFEDGLHANAEKFFRVWLAQAAPGPERTEARIWLARALLGQERREEALRTLDAGAAEAEDNPQRAAWLYWRALTEAELGRHAEALQILADEALARDAAFAARAERLRVRSFRALGQYARALDICARFQEKYSQDAEAAANLLDWAGLLMETGRAREAMELLERLLREYPTAPETQPARLWLGRLELDGGNPGAGVPRLEALGGAADVVPAVRSAAWLDLARWHEGQSNWNRSVAALEQRAQVPADAESRLESDRWRGLVLMRQGKPAEGLELLRGVVATNPASPQAMRAQMDIARNLLDRRDYAAALAEAQRYLEAFTNDTARAQSIKGWSLLGLGRNEEAAAAFERSAALENSPRRKAQDLCKCADALFAAGQHRQALERYRQLVREYPDDALALQALFQTAQCCVALNERDAAMQAYAGVVGRGSNSPLRCEAILGAARLEADRQHWSGALARYNGLLADPRAADYGARAMLGRALVNYQTGRFAEALTDFDALTRDARYGAEAERAFFMRGWCQYLLGRDEEALAVCREFIRRYPHSQWAPEVLFWLGEYYFNHGRYDLAEGHFSQLADTYPKHELADGALYWAGRAAAARKEFLRALDYCNRLLEGSPRSSRRAEARFAQGDALSELGRFSEAILTFDDIIKNMPESYLVDQAWGRRGDCQFTLGSSATNRLVEALGSYRMVLDSPRADPVLKWQAQYKLGRCLEKLGRTDEALEQYLNVVYTFAAAQARGEGHQGAWFTRAAFGAAEILEQRRNWRSALDIYRRVEEAGGAAAREARERIRRIRMEQWVPF